jgi:DNA modification methylase
VRKGATGHWQGARDQSTVWNIDASGIENLATVHGTQKPVECMRRPMLNNSRRGDAIYEPFGGSGSTIIAAETIGRRAYAMELSEVYCDLIIRRWQTFTGQVAMHGRTGATFAATAERRYD